MPVVAVLAFASGLRETLSRQVDEGRPGSAAEVRAYTWIPPPPHDFHASLDAVIFHSTSWFHIDKAATLAGGRGRVPRPTIYVWVDTTRVGSSTS